MPSFVASIEVYFDAKDAAEANDVTDAFSDAVADWDVDNDVRVTAITSGVTIVAS